MLQYLVVLLDDTSVSFCHYQYSEGVKRLISLNDLKQAIRFGMMENLYIQFVYPPEPLPSEYLEVIETIDHCKILPYKQKHEGNNVYILDSWDDLTKAKYGEVFVFRTSKNMLFSRYRDLIEAIKRGCVVNLVILDIDTFNEEDFIVYKDILSLMVNEFGEMIDKDEMPQLNVITDRLILKQMNNCGAGGKSVTLAPNGKFYVCPAFYYEDTEDSVGDLNSGLNIRNKQLYELLHAPICSHCDAYHCKRCVWLNRKTTLEVNTPSYEQCVVAHLERNASRELLELIKAKGKNITRMAEIDEIDYLDPIIKHREWQ